MAQKNSFTVKDIGLSPSGQESIRWAEAHMPVLMKIKERFSKSKPFSGIRVGLCLHVTKETAVLAKALVAGGAQVGLCASNPLSTQDDVAAALAKEGIEVHAVRGCNNEEYYAQINHVLDNRPQMLVDDGADLINMVHGKRTELLKDVLTGQEETTTGVIRLKAMAKDGKLKFPVIAVNDTPTKHLFDNYYGTGQSTIDAIMRATNKMLAGSTFVVVGYGQCGKGLAMRAKGMGCRVVVVEVDPVEALRAAMDGHSAMNMDDAAAIGDVFVTVTGDKNVIRGRHFSRMKSGAIVANSGHFNVELCIGDLEKLAKSKKAILPNVEEYVLADGRKICLLAEGRLVNLAAGAGHPSEVMDLSFADQALVLEYLSRHGKGLKPGVHDVPKEIDLEVATLKAESMGIGIEKLTEEQIAYLNAYAEGT
ncbi:MAG: adenosylhomocysteinase [Candidatus Micrarchaeia archaeon]